MNSCDWKREVTHLPPEQRSPEPPMEKTTIQEETK